MQTFFDTFEPILQPAFDGRGSKLEPFGQQVGKEDHDNEYNRGRHIWDRRDAAGFLGATASVVVPWYIERYEGSGDYQPLGWWIRDNRPPDDVLCLRSWSATAVSQRFQ